MATEPAETPQRYAVYDNTAARYTTGAVSKADADQAAKDGPNGHDLKVVKV